MVKLLYLTHVYGLRVLVAQIFGTVAINLGSAYVADGPGFGRHYVYRNLGSCYVAGYCFTGDTKAADTYRFNLEIGVSDERRKPTVAASSLASPSL